MTPPETTPRPRRVIIALDPEAQCLSALEAAARLAAQRGAELVGLFVEDSALIDAAALPMTRNIRRSGAAEEAVDARRMEQGLRVWAARAEAMLKTAAARWRVQSSFRVARGDVAERLLAEAGDCELLALGTVGRRSAGTRLGGTARRIARGAKCSVMVMRCEGLRHRPVIVLYEGAARALAMGAELADMHGCPLEVLAVGADAAAAEAAEATAADWLAAHDVAATVHGHAGHQAQAIYALLSDRSPNAIVVDRQGALGRLIDVEQALERPTASVLVVG